MLSFKYRITRIHIMFIVCQILFIKFIKFILIARVDSNQIHLSNEYVHVLYYYISVIANIQ